MKHVVVGTAGHIDHGKTSLVKALTGTDTDRLPEEKARGITIDLGFAFLEEPGDLTIEIVDVPGHERFVKNMLAGVGGIDLAMLVIAADEGVMPQTREHLAICSLLHIKSGLIALTKTDLAEPDWIDLVREDVRGLLDGTFLGGSPIVPVSVKTGAGLAELRGALADLARAVPAKSADQTPRLPVDRVFTVRGFGTVVTGTLASGRLAVEDRVEVYPRGVASKVRGLQVHGQPVESASAGQRTAVNLQGVERAAIERGDVVAPPGALVPTLLADATLELLADAPRSLKVRDRVRFHVGTQEVMARVLLVDRAALDPGQVCYGRFRLEAPVVALPGDRFVIRSYSPIVTIGGGTLLDVAPPRFKRRAPALLAHLTLLDKGAPAQVLEEHLRQAGASGGRATDLRARTPFGPERLRQLLEEVVTTGAVVAVDREWYLHREANDRLRSQAIGLLEAFHADYPLRAGISREESPEPGGQCPGAGIRPAPVKPRSRDRGEERQGSGAAGLAFDTTQRRATAGRHRPRGGLPAVQRNAAEPRGGPRPSGRKGEREARAVPAPGGGPAPPAREGGALLPRRVSGDDPGPAHRLPEGEEGDRPRRDQRPPRREPEIRHPAPGVLRRPARDGAPGRAPGAPRSKGVTAAGHHVVTTMRANACGGIWA